MTTFKYLKMLHLSNCVLMSMLLMIADGITVKGPSETLVVPLGGSVVLPCFVDKPLLSEELEVEWRRSDTETLVHLYQDGESRPEVQQQDYHDRAHFFTDKIQHGNFSLLLNNVTAEDEGKYRCKVFSGQDSGETVVEIKHVERLIVSGSDHSISAYAGEDVTLNCSVDSRITPEEIEELSWKKTDEDGIILVLLYQNNKPLPESSHEQYRDRVEFFTDEISKGNFSLRLKSVRTEDKGVYMCQVFAGGVSANTTVELEQLGFSVLHIMMLILCITASGSALLLCYLIYCRTHKDSVLRLHVFLVFCPNIIMFFAFVLWGVSEGSLNETLFCCVLYLLRPLMLLWAAPYIKVFTGYMYTFIYYFSYSAEYFIFSTVVYSVLFKSALEKGLSYAGLEGVVIIVLFVIVLLLCLLYFINMFAKIFGKLSKRITAIFNVLAGISFNLLPSLQFILMFYTFGSARGGLFIVAVLPVFTTATRYNWNVTCGDQMGCSPLVRRSVWLMFMSLINAVIMYFYIIALENETDSVGWGCLIGFLQLLWTIVNFTWSFIDREFPRLVPMYLFGSVGVVLISAVSLMTELILKKVNGERAVGDLRIVVFSCESFLSYFLLILLVFKPSIKTCQQSCQNAAGSDETPVAGSNQNQNSVEMNPLLQTHDQEAGQRKEKLRRYSV
ncbi:uncharacterized protein LOC127647776 isoform X4 [Xyrauchen texanus]|uniref:uncharacterized protein LOC127647776 isoform X4 n=1 Tax=Xyrauchen texanus TaxID=154827 RepID=UPI0022429E4A|nr:uncharacterized protein LOC127647776 isoform X4 [Xyrauchen texanus]